MDDCVIRQGALTEPVRGPSAPLQRIIARDEEQDRPILRLGLADRFREVDQPGDPLPRELTGMLLDVLVDQVGCRRQAGRGAASRVRWESPGT